MKFIGIPQTNGLNEEIKTAIANGFSTNPVAVFVDSSGYVWFPAEWLTTVQLTHYPAYSTVETNTLDEFYNLARINNFAPLNTAISSANWAIHPEAANYAAQMESTDTIKQIAMDSTIDSGNETISVVDQAQTAIVQELPDSVVNALETTGNVTQNIVDTIYTATGADSTQNTDAEKTARAKKVLLGISAGILAFKIFS